MGIQEWPKNREAEYRKWEEAQNPDVAMPRNPHADEKEPDEEPDED